MPVAPRRRWQWLLGAGLLLGCAPSDPGAGTSGSARSPAAKSGGPASSAAPLALGDLAVSLADLKTRWNARASRDGKVPPLGELELSRANAVDTFRLPPFDLGAPVVLAGVVNHETQVLVRVTLTIASRSDEANRALRRAIEVLLDAIDPDASLHKHQIAELSIPSGASGSADFSGGYTVEFETKEGAGELSIVPTTAARLAAMRDAGAEPIR